MKILLNGEDTDSGEVRTVADLVRQLGLTPQAVLIEHNGQALLRQEWPERILAEGDRVELLRVVAGG